VKLRASVFDLSLRFAFSEIARVLEVEIDLESGLARFPRPAHKSLLVEACQRLRDRKFEITALSTVRRGLNKASSDHPVDIGGRAAGRRDTRANDFRKRGGADPRRRDEVKGELHLAFELGDPEPLGLRHRKARLHAVGVDVEELATLPGDNALAEAHDGTILGDRSRWPDGHREDHEGGVRPGLAGLAAEKLEERSFDHGRC